MANKSFSIYSLAEDTIAGADDRIILEVGKTHFAILVKKEQKRSVSAFELFGFTENEAADFPKLFKTIAASSQLLAKSYATAEVFINNELSLLVPIFKFNTQIAADYLDVVFGEDAVAKIQFEHLPIEPGMMNVFRLAKDVTDVFDNNFAKVSIKHTWSNIIKTVISNNSAYPADCIYIRFYITFITVIVIKDKNLQIIQSFVYETPEDVMYHLLNIIARFGLNNNEITLLISGMIDLNFTLYRDLITYFTHVEVQNVNTTNLLLNIKEYPLHYFTPFFNLAL